MSTTLSLTINAVIGKSFVPTLRRQLHRAHTLLKPTLNELSIALVNDKMMGELHEQFMSIPGPTDVLTFPLEANGRGQVTSGEVVICVPEARRRAREIGVAVQHELLLYALHGMLHLSGFDDKTARQYQRMHQMEDTILRRLGVGPVFNMRTAERPAARTARRNARRSSSAESIIVPDAPATLTVKRVRRRGRRL